MNNNFNIWYNKPAKIWDEATPLGNGRMGGMVYGDINKEVIQINEESLWSGMPLENQKKDFTEIISNARNLLFEDKFVETQEMLTNVYTEAFTETYEPLGEIHIDLLEKIEEDHYKKVLNLTDSTLKVTSGMEEAACDKEMFISHVDDVFVIRYKASKKQKLNLKFYATSILKNTLGECKDNYYILKGRAPAHTEPPYRKIEPAIVYEENKGMYFELHTKLIIEGGSSEYFAGRITVKDADYITFLVTSATSFNGYKNNPVTNGKDPNQICRDILKKVSKFTYEELKERHIDDYQRLFNRLELKIGNNDKDSLPVNERLEAFKNGEEDEYLVTLLYQFGRYLTISSSREGTQATNLQGIWNDQIRPNWSSNYTVNINTQMSYWPVEVANLSECHMPLFDFIKEISETGREVAKSYGCRGWAVNHNVDIWKSVYQVGKSLSGEIAEDCAHYAFWPMSGVWLCRHIWEHYLYTNDIDFLKKYYEVMEGAALFCLDWLIEDKEGNLVTAPSTTPENVFYDNEYNICRVSVGTTMDMSLCREIFNICIKSNEILSKENSLVKEFKNAKEKLLPYKKGEYGQLLEWSRDYEEVDRGHRHQSHLYGLYPSNQITYEDNDLALACEKTLRRRLTFGGGDIGWSCAWLISLWARLLKADEAYKMVRRILTDLTYDNFFDFHPPIPNSGPTMQVDGNFGFVAGVSEMLLQSHNDYIFLLPSLPSKWDNGYIKGLKARGGHVVSMEWEENKLNKAVIKVSSKEKVKICSWQPFKIVELNIESQKINDFYSVKYLGEKNKLYTIVKKIN